MQPVKKESLTYYNGLGLGSGLNSESATVAI